LAFSLAGAAHKECLAGAAASTEINRNLTSENSEGRGPLNHRAAARYPKRRRGGREDGGTGAINDKVGLGNKREISG